MIRTAITAAGLAAGITLAAGPATAAMASSQPFSLSVSPGRLAAGAPGSVRELTVSNDGTKPVTIHAELAELARNNGRCAVGHLGTLPWAAVKPLSFTLQPGGRKTARLRIGHHVPGGAHELVTAFVAAPSKSSVGVSVSGAVGAQMLVQGKGPSAATPPCLAPAGPPRKPHLAAKLAAVRPVPWLLIAIGALVAAVIALLVGVIVRQRRRIRASTPTAAP